MYTHAYDAKVMRIEIRQYFPALGIATPTTATLEVDLGFRIWKIQVIKLDEEPPKDLIPGDMVRLHTRLERRPGIGADHTYWGRIKRL